MANYFHIYLSKFKFKIYIYIFTNKKKYMELTSKI